MFETEFLDLPALTSAGGRVALPGSKSISNRVLLLAALAEGTTRLAGLLRSDDTRVMLDALRTLGCRIDDDATAGRPDGDLVIHGCGGRFANAKAELFLGNAGTAMRPLAATLALLGGDHRLSGVPRMHERPIGDLVDALRALGCRVGYSGKEGFPPLSIGLPQLRLDAPIRVRGDVSSQFLTALLLALPLVAKQPIHIEVVGELISKPYVEITLALLQRFGVEVAREGWQRFTIPAGSTLRSPGDFRVEPDASSASYFIAVGALAASAPGTNGIEIRGLDSRSLQGDVRFVDAVRAMGAQVTEEDGALHIARGAWPLHAIDLDCNHIPDAAMTLATLALYADGPSMLRNIASWRVKETDRIHALAVGLQQLGATVEEGADFLRITPPIRMADWRAAAIETFDDHRVAMCFSLAAFNPAGLPVRILDPKCVAKTFPDYFETLFAAAQALTAQIPVICIDGPSASGKGTVAAAVAARLGYHFLDSGAIYRAAALAAVRAGIAIDPANAERIAELARELPVRFEDSRILLGSDDVSDVVRSEDTGRLASQVSALLPVRTALVALQHGFRRLPGLVADGRDMGTVIFPDARLKIYLTASPDKRAERRHKQLISKGFPSTIAGLAADLKARDARDSSRLDAPLKPAQDALLLDNSALSIEQSVEQVLAWWQGRQPFAH